MPGQGAAVGMARALEKLLEEGRGSMVLGLGQRIALGAEGEGEERSVACCAAAE